MTAALEGGEWSAARPGRILPLGMTRYPFYKRLGGAQGRSGRAKNLAPTEIRSRTVQPLAQSLYRLSYPAHNQIRSFQKPLLRLNVLRCTHDLYQWVQSVPCLCAAKLCYGTVLMWIVLFCVNLWWLYKQLYNSCWLMCTADVFIESCCTRWSAWWGWLCRITSSSCVLQKRHGDSKFVNLVLAIVRFTYRSLWRLHT